MNTLYSPDPYRRRSAAAGGDERRDDAALPRPDGSRWRIGRRGQSSIHDEARTPLLLLFGITGVVLLIACANIANLLLARGASRATEMGVRLALGANRRQLLTQLLTESVVLAVLGGAASLRGGRWTLKAIGSLLPPEATDSLRLRAAAVGGAVRRRAGGGHGARSSGCSPRCTARAPISSPRSAPAPAT